MYKLRKLNPLILTEREETKSRYFPPKLQGKVFSEKKRKCRIVIHSAAAVGTANRTDFFFYNFEPLLLLQMKTYGSDFFDDKINSQCQQKKENTNSIANLFENPDSIIVTAATIDCCHF